MWFDRNAWDCNAPPLPPFADDTQPHVVMSAVNPALHWILSMAPLAKLNTHEPVLVGHSVPVTNCLY
jgi:hypothetical protein